MDTAALQTALDVLGPEGLGRGARLAVYARSPLRMPSQRVLLCRMPTDAVHTAQELFAVLRELDSQGVALIWVETPPTTQDWDGVRDRLQRAAAG
jgi:L-threonylcarbamoyladenylate synthase